MTTFESLLNYPSLSIILDRLLRAWPDHLDFINTRITKSTPDTLKTADQLSSAILRIATNFDSYIYSYKQLCSIMFEEALYFKRHKSYRYSSFDEVNRLIYSNASFMQDYLKGLLLSQVLWENQTSAFSYYLSEFLPLLPPSSGLLEIGPGHGLLLYFASLKANINSIAGLDISDASLKMTISTLKRLHAPLTLKCINHDIQRPRNPQTLFQAVIASEVLEHLENPALALLSIYNSMHSEGFLFLNVPINSPAPDHIYNWDAPELLLDQIRDVGFNVIDSKLFPMTGYTLARALKSKATINVCVIAKR